MASSRHPLLSGNAGSLSDALAVVEPGARLVAEERLAGRVRRVTLTRGRRSSLVVKRVDRVAARKTDLLSSHWLPAVGLRDRGPPLLASVPGRGEAVWQVFEDLGDCGLLPDRPEPGDLEAATHLVAQLHVAFAGCSLLREWTDEFGGLGERFYADWVQGRHEPSRRLRRRAFLPIASLCEIGSIGGWMRCLQRSPGGRDVYVRPAGR